MKKTYLKPSVLLVSIKPSSILQGSKVYTDDPQSPGSALSRRSRFASGGLEDLDE